MVHIQTGEDHSPFTIYDSLILGALTYTPREQDERHRCVV